VYCLEELYITSFGMSSNQAKLLLQCRVGGRVFPFVGVEMGKRKVRFIVCDDEEEEGVDEGMSRVGKEGAKPDRWSLLGTRLEESVTVYE